MCQIYNFTIYIAIFYIKSLIYIHNIFSIIQNFKYTSTGRV